MAYMDRLSAWSPGDHVPHHAAPPDTNGPGLTAFLDSLFPLSPGQPGLPCDVPEFLDSSRQLHSHDSLGSGASSSQPAALGQAIGMEAQPSYGTASQPVATGAGRHAEPAVLPGSAAAGCSGRAAGRRGGHSGAAAASRAPAVAPGPDPAAGSSSSGDGAGAQSAGADMAQNASAEEIEKALRARARMTLKNRRAQARFRERRKAERETTAEQLAALTAQVAALSRDKAAAEQRAALLERCLQLNSAHSQADPAQQRKQPGVQGQPHADELYETSCAFLTALRPECMPPTRAEHDAITVVQAISCYKELKRQVHALITAAGSDDSCAAARKAAHLVDKFRRMVSCMAVCDPKFLNAIDAALLEEQESAARTLLLTQGDPDSAMGKLASKERQSYDAMRLGAGQKAQLAALYNSLRARTADIATERRSIAALLEGLSLADQQAGPVYDDSTRGARVKRTARVAAAAEDLTRTVAAEGAVLAACVQGWLQAVTPLQEARGMAAAHPWGLCKMGTAALAAEEESARTAPAPAAGLLTDFPYQDMLLDLAGPITGAPQQALPHGLGCPDKLTTYQLHSGSFDSYTSSASGTMAEMVAAGLL